MAVRRRSARVEALQSNITPLAPISTSTTPKKRVRKTDPADATRTSLLSTNGTVTETSASNHAAHDTLQPPTTPNVKRRKVATKPPPVTPTPTAIGMMLSKTPAITQSTGDIDDPMPSKVIRPAEPHHTNAPLKTSDDSSSQVVVPSYSNFEESPSKALAARQDQTATATSTTATLLDEAKAHLLSVDPKLSDVTAAHHCRAFDPEGLAEEIDPFRSLASGIMAQQVSGAAASAIKAKFINLFPDRAPHFPLPEVVAKTDLSVLRSAGLSGRKAEYIQGLAQKFADGELSARMLADASDDEVMEKLVAVRGLGRWSVEMFCCFGLKRMDVFSTGDLGVQRGMAAYMGRDVGKLKSKGGKWKYMSEKDMLDISAKFSPYRSLFMWYMWRIEDVQVDAIQNA